MVLRTIYSRYDTKDGIQTHTYTSDQVQLLIIHIDRDKVILSGLQELVVLHVSVLILFEVIIIAHEGCSSLNVFTFFFQLPQLGLLSLNSLLQGWYLRAEASNGGVLLGTLLAKVPAVVVE